MKNLSLVGRITLAKLVLIALPLYVMQMMKLSTFVCDKVEQKGCNFVWGTTKEGMKSHLIKWDDMC